LVVFRRWQDLHQLGASYEESPGLVAIDVLRHLSTLPAPLGTHHRKPPTGGARPPIDRRRASEHLWYLLAEASQLEHGIMCQYPYACFSLKQSVEEGLTAEQLAALNRWRTVLQGIAVQEMVHLALVANLMPAIGAAPTFTRSNFPRRSDYFPSNIQLSLLPFGEAALTHFLFLERPEGMERMDAEGFVPVNPSRQPVAPDEDFPHAQDYATVGHLYRGIADGLRHLANRSGERGLFAGSPQALARPEVFYMLKWLRVCVSPPRASSRRPRGPAPGPANPPRTARSPGRAFALLRRPQRPASPSRGSNRCRRENLRSRAGGWRQGRSTQRPGPRAKPVRHLSNANTTGARAIAQPRRSQRSTSEGGNAREYRRARPAGSRSVLGSSAGWLTPLRPAYSRVMNGWNSNRKSSSSF